MCRGRGWSDLAVPILPRRLAASQKIAGAPEFVGLDSCMRMDARLAG